MVIVWLVRHGRTAWNVGRRFQGWTDVPLDDVGRAQARELAVALDGTRFDHIWSSDLSRAVDTARIAVGAAPTIDPRLREMDFGRLEGVTWEQMDPATRNGLKTLEGFVAPGGESAAEVEDRVFGFLDDLPDGRHLVVTHGGVIRTVGRACGDDGFPGHASILRVNWSRRTLASPGSG